MSEGPRAFGKPVQIRRMRLGDLAFWGLVSLMVAAFVAWHWQPAQRFPWKFDEGVNVIKSRLLLAGHGLYREIWSDQAPLFTVLLAGAFSIFGQSVFVGRALVLGFSALVIVATGSIARRLAGRTAALAAILFLVLLPRFHQLCRVILIGLPAISVGLVALVAGLAFQANRKIGWLTLSGLLFGLSLLIKPLTAPLYLPLSALALLDSGAAKQRIRLWVAFSAIVAGTLLLTLVLFSPPTLLRQVAGTLTQAREADGLSLAENMVKLGAFFFRDKWKLSYAGLLSLAVVGLLCLVVRRRWSHLVPLALWLVGALGTLVLHSPLRDHQVFLLVPAIVVFAGLGAQQALAGLRTFGSARLRQRLLTVAACLALVLTAVNLVPAAQADLAMRVDSLATREDTPTRLDALQFLRSRTSPDSVIITDDPMLAFKSGRLIPPTLAVPSYRRVEAGELPPDLLIDLTREVHPAAILFWERRLKRVAEYADWVSANYCLIRAYSDERWIYVPCDSAEIASPQPASTPDGVAFLGSSVKHLGVNPGDSLQITLSWHAKSQISQDYTTFVQLLDAQGNCWGQVDQQPFDGHYPTSKWPPGGTFIQEISLPVRADAPAGEQTLSVGLYDAQVHRLPLYDAEDRRLPGDQVILTPRPVVRWKGRFDLPAPSHEREATLGGYVRLLGYDLDDEPVHPGAVVTLTLHWQSLDEMDTSYTVFAHMLDEQGALVAQRDQVPGEGAFPTTGWRPREVIIDQHRVLLPQDTPGGTYTFVIGMYDLETGLRLAAVDANRAPLANDAVPVGQVTVHE